LEEVIVDIALKAVHKSNEPCNFIEQLFWVIFQEKTVTFSEEKKFPSLFYPLQIQLG
jgi:hypothetical protein